MSKRGKVEDDPYYDQREVEAGLADVEHAVVMKLAEMDPDKAADWIHQAVWADTSGKTQQQKEQEVEDITDRVNRERDRAAAQGKRTLSGAFSLAFKTAYSEARRIK